MINFTELIMVVVLLSVLLSLGSTRLMAMVRIMALQGVMVSLTPLLLKNHSTLSGNDIIFYLVMILIKGVLIPMLLYMAVRKVAIKREIEPYIGYHTSIVTGLAIIVVSVFITNNLSLSLTSGNGVILVTAITTIGAGFFLMMARVKAITQVIGYLMLENGIYLVGTALTDHHHTIYVVEFGVLLDLLVGVMIMGIILHNINRAFDDIDTTLLGRLRD